MMMMMVDEEFQDCDDLSLEDIDLSLLRLTSPPCDYSHSRSLSVSSASTEASPLKRSSPVSDESDQPKRRRLSPQNPILINSPLRFTHPETQSSIVENQTRNLNLSAGGRICCCHTSSVSEKQETSPFGFKTLETEKKQTMKMVNDPEETNYDSYEKEQEKEEDCGEGMRIERSGEGFIIRLKCRCKLAFRVLFSDHHLYFKPL